MAKSLRVLVVIPEGFAALREDLGAQAPRYRAERVRLLATIGLLALGAAPGPSAPAAPDPIARAATGERLRRVRELLAGL